MSLTDYVIMPAADYLDACNATREKTGGMEPIKSGEMGGLIRGISGGGEVIKGLCEGVAFDLAANNVEAVTETTFANSKVKSVNLPNAKEIVERAFNRCWELASVDAPEVVKIGNNAFDGCEKLESINLPKLQECGDGAFKGCYILTEAVLPMLQAVPYRMFANGDNLNKVDLTACISIGAEAFAFQPITALILRNTETVVMIDLSAFDMSGIQLGMGYIYIHASMWDAYAAVYGDYMSIVRKIEDYPEICG